MKKSRVKTCVDRQRKNIVGYQEKKKKKKSEEKKNIRKRKKGFQMFRVFCCPKDKVVQQILSKICKQEHFSSFPISCSHVFNLFLLDFFFKPEATEYIFFFIYLMKLKSSSCV